MSSRLTETKTLWRLFGIFAILSIAMLSWILYFDLHIIDEIASPEKVKDALAQQTPEQHKAHFNMTLYFDLLYPFIYGPLFAGLVLKNFKGGWKWLSVPAFLCIPSDTIENISQLFILSGNMAPLGIKAIATPIKLACFILALVLALIAVTIGFKKRKA